MKELISSDKIAASKEDVYESVIQWVKHDVSSRECLLPELLKSVRAFSMSKYSLREILDKEELVTKNPTCMRPGCLSIPRSIPSFTAKAPFLS